MIAEPVDLNQPDDVIMEQVERGYERTRAIPMGGRTEQYLAPTGEARSQRGKGRVFSGHALSEEA